MMAVREPGHRFLLALRLQRAGVRHTDIAAVHDSGPDAACKCRCVSEPQIESLPCEWMHDMRRISNECRSVTDIRLSMSEA